MSRYFSYILMAFIFFNAPALACYTPKEFEAEQGLRIHSELMVIGLTCMKMPEGPVFYQKYQNFTRNNADLIAGYEAALIDHYTAQGVPDPEQRFHTLRTGLANNVSRRAVNMSVLSFCQEFAPRIDAALSMDQAKLRRWAQQVWPQQPASEPMCSPGI